MASLPRPASAFAFTLKEGDVFTVNRSGGDLVVVTEPPQHIVNLVGERQYMLLTVRKVYAPSITGQMILPTTSVIFMHQLDPQELS
jgi:hypothetical protein